MTDIVERLRTHKVSQHHGGCADCYAMTMEEAADEIKRLMRCIDMAMGCLDPTSRNPDEVLAWHRLFDAEMGREPRPSLTGNE